ncbi:hypothetical protein BDQ17DRAFT_1332994 [Cyathus striatus]|nr:hypothetical protein BDQ17DRAFT_1332994 [Cyathus striatus]
MNLQDMKVEVFSFQESPSIVNIPYLITLFNGERAGLDVGEKDLLKGYTALIWLCGSFDHGVITHLLAICVLYYDHILTLDIFITIDDEVDYIWKRPKRGSAYWFFVNRYVTFFGNVLVTIAEFSSLLQIEANSTETKWKAVPFQTINRSCQKFYVFQQGLLVFNQLVVSILLTLRIHALYECSRRILLCLLSIGAILLVVIFWSLVSQRGGMQPQIGIGCRMDLSRETCLDFSYEAGQQDDITRPMEYLLSFHLSLETEPYIMGKILMVFLLALLSIVKLNHSVMALTNLANILTYYVASSVFSGGFSTFASSISVTMMSRLMLNLHQSTDIGIYSTTSSSDIRFIEQDSVLKAQMNTHNFTLYVTDDNQISWTPGFTSEIRPLTLPRKPIKLYYQELERDEVF